MRVGVGTAEAADLAEQVTIHHVFVHSSLMNTQRNPFRGPAPQSTRKTKGAESKKEPDRLSTQPSSKVMQPDIQSLNASAEGERIPATYPVPKVAFPYITELNADLEGNFDLILDSLPALPCEVEQRKVKLPPPSKLMTLVLGLEGTLIALPSTVPTPTQENGPSFPRPILNLRPHATEFLHELSMRFEIIVTKSLIPHRYSRLGPRAILPTCSRR